MIDDIEVCGDEVECHTIRARREDKEKLERDRQEFINNGGKITMLPMQSESVANANGKKRILF